jgi:hypothetical protein
MPISQLGNGTGPGDSDHEPYRKVPRLVLELDGAVLDAFPPGAMTSGVTHDAFPEVRA